MFLFFYFYSIPFRSVYFSLCSPAASAVGRVGSGRVVRSFVRSCRYMYVACIGYRRRCGGEIMSFVFWFAVRACVLWGFGARGFGAWSVGWRMEHRRGIHVAYTCVYWLFVCMLVVSVCMYVCMLDRSARSFSLLVLGGLYVRLRGWLRTDRGRIEVGRTEKRLSTGHRGRGR